jgi:hypothetical protein
MAVHALDGASDDGKPNAGPFEFLLPLNPLEDAEHLALMLRGDADAVVLDVNPNLRVTVWRSFEAAIPLRGR